MSRGLHMLGYYSDDYAALKKAGDSKREQDREVAVQTTVLYSVVGGVLVLAVVIAALQARYRS